MTGLSKRSLQTWQRREDSRGARRDKGVSSQSVESARSMLSMPGWEVWWLYVCIWMEV